MKWLLCLPLLLTACQTPVHEQITGTVTVLETHATYQYVSVETTSSVRAVRVTPPFGWVDGSCYTLTVVDPQGDADGSSHGEPYAVSMIEGGC